MRDFSIHRFIPLLLIVLFALCSCDSQVECIDPDNWGGRFATRITSVGTDANTEPIRWDESTNPPKVTQDAIDWTKGYELNGQKVVLIVKNNNSLTSDRSCNSPQAFTLNNTWIPVPGRLFGITNPGLCIFPPGPAYPWCPAGSRMEIDNVPVLNLPCRMNYGLGLYATIGTTTPRRTDLNCAMNPDSEVMDNCLLHIGDSAYDIPHADTRSVFYDQLCPAAGAAFSPQACTGTNCGTRSIYFKILDRYYRDNMGGYTVEFLQGVRPQGGGVITKFVGLVQLLLCNVTEGLYKSLVEQSDFISYIRALLILYVIFLGLGSLMGFSRLTHQELLTRALKIGLIVQLTSAGSWEFFNEYFFKLFTHGVGVITGIIFGYEGGDLAPIKVEIPWLVSSPGCSAQTLAGFSALDDIVNILFSYETTRKILSLLVWRAYGFIFIGIIYVCLGFVLFVLIKAVIMYLVSFLIISILIVLAPIFIPFFLFEFTRNFFNKWLKALISYFVQPILVLTFAFFLLQIILAQLQSMVGYRVCWKHWFGIPDPVNRGIYAWQHDFDRLKVGCILTPNAILSYDSGSAIRPSEDWEKLKFIGDLNIETFPGKNSCGYRGPGTDELCTKYNCSQVRYLGYPYLDVHSPNDASRIEDLQRLDSDGEHAPDLVSFTTIVVFILIIWFMNHFSKLVPDIVKSIAGGKVGTSSVAAAVVKGIPGGLGEAAIGIGSPIYAVATGWRPWNRGGGRRLREDLRATRLARAIRTMRELPGGLKESMQDYMGNKIESAAGAVEGLSKKMHDKLKEKMLKSKLGTLAYYTGRALVAPHKMIGEGLEKTGQTTRKLAANAKEGAVESAQRFAKRVQAYRARRSLNQAKDAIKAGKVKEAAKLYRDAADKGNAEAMNSLATMYVEGTGVKEDLDEAKKLYKSAIENGDESAKAELEKLEKHIAKLEAAKKRPKEEKDIFNEENSVANEQRLEKLEEKFAAEKEGREIEKLEREMFDKPTTNAVQKAKESVAKKDLFEEQTEEEANGTEQEKLEKEMFEQPTTNAVQKAKEAAAKKDLSEQPAVEEAHNAEQEKLEKEMFGEAAGKEPKTNLALEALKRKEETDAALARLAAAKAAKDQKNKDKEG